MNPKLKSPLVSFITIIFASWLIYSLSSALIALNHQFKSSPTIQESQTTDKHSDSQAAPPKEWSTFTSPDSDLSINYPSSWHLTYLQHSSYLGKETELDHQAWLISSVPPQLFELPQPPNDVESAANLEIIIANISATPQLATAFDCSSQSSQDCTQIKIHDLVFSKLALQDKDTNQTQIIVSHTTNDKLYLLVTNRPKSQTNQDLLQQVINNTIIK